MVEGKFHHTTGRFTLASTKRFHHATGHFTIDAQSNPENSGDVHTSSCQPFLGRAVMTEVKSGRASLSSFRQVFIHVKPSAGPVDNASPPAHRDVGHVLLRGEDELVVGHVVRGVAQPGQGRGRVQRAGHPWRGAAWRTVRGRKRDERKVRVSGYGFIGLASDAA